MESVHMAIMQKQLHGNNCINEALGPDFEAQGN